MQTRRPYLLISLVFSLASSLIACGDKGAEAPAGPPKKTAADLKPAFEKDALAAVNAARPAGAATEFVVGVFDDDRVLAAVPKGWEESKVIPGNFKPPTGSDLGFMTSFRIGTNCDGMCSAKDWKATAEKVNFGQFRKAESFEITEEKALTAPEGKLMVAKSKDAMGVKTYITAARWKEGANHYITCSATLEGDAAAALLPAMVKACEVTQGVELQ